MTKDQKQWHEDNIKQAMRRLGITRVQYFRLRRFSNRLNELDTKSCNGEIGEWNGNENSGGYLDSEAHYELLRNDIYIKLECYLYKIGKLSLSKYHQTDPRGASLYLHTEPLTQSNYINGVCIY